MNDTLVYFDNNTDAEIIQYKGARIIPNIGDEIFIDDQAYKVVDKSIEYKGDCDNNYAIISVYVDVDCY